MRVNRFAYRAFGRLPKRWVTRFVRWGSPNYTVGTMVLVRGVDDRVLLQRNEHRPDWGLPGGLVRRGERPVDGARREVFEETGLRVDLEDDPVYVLDSRAQRVDVVFDTTVGSDSVPIATSGEVIEVQWWAPDQLPVLHSHTVGAFAALARAGRWGSIRG